MKKRLLLSLTALVALTASAQKNSSLTDAKKNFNSTNPYKVEKVNLNPTVTFENNKKTKLEKSATTVTDTCSVTNAKWNISGAMDPNSGTDSQTYGLGGAYTLGAYPNQDDANNTDYLSAVQTFPMVGSMELTALGMYVKADNTVTTGSGSGDIFVINQGVLAGSTSFTTTSSYGYVWVDFSSPITLTDTFTIYVQPSSPTDRVSLVHTDNVENLGINSFLGFLNVYTEDADAAMLDNQNYPVANNGSAYTDGDWQIFPVVNHTFNNVTTPDVSCLTGGNLTANFDFATADTNMLLNPIFNVNAFMIQYLGQTRADNRYYATIEYVTEEEGDTLDVVTTGTDFMFSKTYAAAGTKYITVNEFYKSWGWASTASYTSSSDLTLACASLEENNSANFSVFPNPANDVVSVSLNNVSGTIRLLSADGKVIESREVSSSVENFNVKSLNAGVYFIQVGQTTQKLMVK